MSTATFTPGPATTFQGATALGPDQAAASSGGTHEHRHFVGNALRAVKVFAAAAFSVVVLGEYTDAEK
ncbi:hypothetical protein [Streptomyces sp. NPDC003077]|uniref:hypothetical protein n=1 Tax=Streptomyces sp. NPDC003077 TaxID=3154443 RepID=UPI0033AFB0B3